MKALDVAKWFVARSAQEGEADYDMTNMKLQKLLYFAQARHLHETGEPLFSEALQAWNHGPVVPEVYRTFSPSGSLRINQAVGATLDSSAMTETTSSILHRVWQIYGGYSAAKLRDMSHDGAWLLHYRENVQNIVLPLEDIALDALLPDEAMEAGDFIRYESGTQFLNAFGID